MLQTLRQPQPPWQMLSQQSLVKQKPILLSVRPSTLTVIPAVVFLPALPAMALKVKVQCLLGLS
jgi:hypothetical protein